MKKFLKVMLFAFICVVTLGVTNGIVKAEVLEVSKTNFPDEELRNGIISEYKESDSDCGVKYDKKSKKYYVDTEKLMVLSLYDVANYKGIEKFVNLKTLNVSGSEAKELDISFATKLRKLDVFNYSYDVSSGKSVVKLKMGIKPLMEELIIYGGEIDGIDISQMPRLKHFSLQGITKGELKLSNSKSLEVLSLTINSVDVLDLSGDTNLHSVSLELDKANKVIWPEKNIISDLDIRGQGIKTLDLSSMSKLKELTVYDRAITSLDISHNPCIEDLALDTGVEEINISNSLALYQLYIRSSEEDPNTYAKKLVLENNHKLERVEIDYPSEINSVTIKGCEKLYSFKAYGDHVKKYDFTDCPNMNEVFISDTALEAIALGNKKILETLWVVDATKLKTIDVSKCPELSELDIRETGISKLDVSKNPKLKNLEYNGSKLQNVKLPKKCKIVLRGGRVKKGHKVNVKKMIGSGYKLYKKSKPLSYNSKTGILKVKKNTKHSFAKIGFKKGSRIVYFHFRF